MCCFIPDAADVWGFFWARKLALIAFTLGVIIFVIIFTAGSSIPSSYRDLMVGVPAFFSCLSVIFCVPVGVCRYCKNGHAFDQDYNLMDEDGNTIKTGRWSNVCWGVIVVFVGSVALAGYGISRSQTSDDPTPTPVVPWSVIGGLYTVSDTSTAYNHANYRTGGISCPTDAEYTAYRFARTVDVDSGTGATTYICLSSLIAVNGTTFGGMYQTYDAQAGAGIVNPYTKALSCPTRIVGMKDYVVTFATTDQPRYPSGSHIHICVNFGTATSKDGDHFGGMYGSWSNPKTGALSCASGDKTSNVARMMDGQKTPIPLIVCH